MPFDAFGCSHLMVFASSRQQPHLPCGHSHALTSSLAFLPRVGWLVNLRGSWAKEQLFPRPHLPAANIPQGSSAREPAPKDFWSTARASFWASMGRFWGRPLPFPAPLPAPLPRPDGSALALPSHSQNLRALGVPLLGRWHFAQRQATRLDRLGVALLPTRSLYCSRKVSFGVSFLPGMVIARR